MQKVTQNEVQTLAISGTPTGGTFTLTYSGQTTSAIAYNASAATVQAALIALSNIGTSNVICAAGALPGAAITITFQGTLANTDVALVTSTASLTGGTSPTITITETLKGGYTSYVHIAKPADTIWTKCTGKTYDTTAWAHFFQLDNAVLVMNGTDTLSYLNIATVLTTPTITTYTSVADPAAPTLQTNTGLTGTAFNVWYAVTANSTVGETTGFAFKQPVLLDRANWNPDTQSIAIEWTTVTGVQSWNIYAAVTADGAGVPTLGLLASGLDASTLSFTDNGSRGIALFATLPIANSTAGPKASRGGAINGRPWLTGDSDNAYYLRFGGNPGHELDFSPANGGGYVILGNGTGEIPCKVWNFRSGQGEPQIKCLTQGINGSGKRYTIASTTLTYGSTSITAWAATEDYGFSGTDSPDGLIVYQNSTYYPSRDGFKVIGTKPQLQNLLSTDTVSDTIQPDLGLLNSNAMGKSVGLGFEGRLSWALPVGSSTNSEMWTLDLNRKGAWMKPWSIPADWLVLVADANGDTHSVVLSNNTIYELSYKTLTSDDGIPFSTSGTTGLTYFSPDGRVWGRLIRVVIEVLRPQGTINFTISGYTSAKKIVPIGTGQLVANIETNGFGWSEGAWSEFGWSSFEGVPTLTGSASVDVPIKINKDVRFFSCTWETTESNVDYNISRIVAEFVNIGVKNLT
jgi:hypothetical protein